MWKVTLAHTRPGRFSRNRPRVMSPDSQDYPGVAKRAIIHLITEECPDLTPPAITEEDPVLGLKSPHGPPPEPFPQAADATMPTPKRPPSGQAPEVETRAATPLTASLYRPRGGTTAPGTSSAFPPRAQDVLAAVARPRHIGASEEEVFDRRLHRRRTTRPGRDGQGPSGNRKGSH